MCSRLKIDGKTYKPGDRIPVRSAYKAGAGKWAGFAREESLFDVWAKTDPVDLEIEAQEFAENHRDGHLAWSTLQDEVIQAIGCRKTGEVRILTRQATGMEESILGHDRVPRTGKRCFDV